MTAYKFSFYHYIWIYTLIFKPNYLLQKYFLLNQMKQTTHQVSCQSLLNHGNFSAGLYLKQWSSRGSLQLTFLQQFLAIESFHNFAFFILELMEKGPLHHLVQNCLHSTFAVDQLPIHFLRVSCTEKHNIEKSSNTVSVSDVWFFDK